MISEQRLDIEGYERVSVFTNKSNSQCFIIALHSSVLGPAVGGCRMRQYETQNDALQDALFLSKGMTYKNSLCGINAGGGKAVIIADPNIKDGRKELFHNFAHCVEAFGGKYFTAEDMGTTVEDMENIFDKCKYVVGRDPSKGGAGNPGPFTARGVFDGLKACLQRVFSSENPQGRHIAIQGIGSVGFDLATRLFNCGAKLTVADTDQTTLAKAKDTLGANVVSLEDIYSVECDVFSPCAIGGTINHSTVDLLNCKIVAGAANNQIHETVVEQKLIDRGILYAPDFAINAGGVIAVADEIQEGGFNEDRVEKLVSRIGNTVGQICDEARSSGILPGIVAQQLAEKRIDLAKK